MGDSAPTIPAYWDDTYQFAGVAIVSSVIGGTSVDTAQDNTHKRNTGSSEANFIVVLDRTIFHPQGGGQPSDTGFIRTTGTLPINKCCEGVVDESKRQSVVVNEGCCGWSCDVDCGGLLARTNASACASSCLASTPLSKESTFVVEHVKKDEKDRILHYGHFTNGSSFAAGQKVELQVEEKARREHARLHTAGHVLDLAVSAAGYSLFGGKGNHHPGSPYVDYSGDLTASERDTFVPRVQAVMDTLIARDYRVSAAVIPYDQIGSHCGGVPTYLPAGRPARIITVHAPRLLANADSAHTVKTNEPAMMPSCPCGGTHVRSTAALSDLRIKKLERKGKLWRVKYGFG